MAAAFGKQGVKISRALVLILKNVGTKRAASKFVERAEKSLLKKELGNGIDFGINEVDADCFQVEAYITAGTLPVELPLWDLS